MRGTRVCAAACVATAAGLLTAGGAAAASADTATATTRVSIAGTAQGGERFRGTYRIERVVRAADGTVYAVVDVRGRMDGRQVARRDVRVAGVLEQPARVAQIPPTPGACQVLSLTLGPLDLNLLGLRVRLSRVDLRIEAIPGGGLLGDLLCALTRGPTAGLTAGPLARALNQQLGLRPPARSP